MQLSPKVLACMIGWICVVTLYYAVFEGLWGAAAGKALCRLRVVGPDRNPPGFARALLRALVYVLPPFVPYWVAFGANPKAYMSASQLTQMLLGLSIYVDHGAAVRHRAPAQRLRRRAGPADRDPGGFPGRRQLAARAAGERSAAAGR